MGHLGCVFGLVSLRDMGRRVVGQLDPLPATRIPSTVYLDPGLAGPPTSLPAEISLGVCDSCRNTVPQPPNVPNSAPSAPILELYPRPARAILERGDPGIRARATALRCRGGGRARGGARGEHRAAAQSAGHRGGRDQRAEQVQERAKSVAEAAKRTGSSSPNSGG